MQTKLYHICSCLVHVFSEWIFAIVTVSDVSMMKTLLFIGGWQNRINSSMCLLKYCGVYIMCHWLYRCLCKKNCKTWVSGCSKWASDAV